MKRDIKWLSQWIEEYESEVIKVIEKRKGEKDELDGFITTLSRGKQSAIKRIKQKIDQLDEPEVPVVPRFVAEWIEETKPYNSLRVAFEYIAQRKRDNHDDELAFWVEEGNSETFARAWLDGYTAEEEQKYIISINITDKASKTNYETFLNKRGIFHSMENDSFNSEEFNWTEEEIKDLESGEILFEHFAVKVEEMEK